MMAQHLVFATGEIMVVAVAAQFKEHIPADGMIAVPAVVRHSAFVFIVPGAFAGQAIVFYVVYGVEQQYTYCCCSYEVQERNPTKY